MSIAMRKRSAKRKYIYGFTGSFLICFCLGCDKQIPVAEVEGVVTLNGKPLDKIQVEFWPLSEGTRSFGTTDTQGKFKLMTDDGLRNGATIGKHKVVLHDTSVLGDKFLGRGGENVDMSEGRKSRISGKYSNPELSNITEEVVSGKKNEFAIEATK
jgi:hypothetical protein